jgi:hypothetical protein
MVRLAGRLYLSLKVGCFDRFCLFKSLRICWNACQNTQKAFGLLAATNGVFFMPIFIVGHALSPKYAAILESQLICIGAVHTLATYQQFTCGWGCVCAIATVYFMC